MIKNLLLSFLLISISFGIELNAQTQFENPGFEEWEPEDINDPTFEPVDWSALKTSDNSFASSAAPIVMKRSNDAHTGNYSVYLVNIYNSLIDYVATGSVTNGRVHVDPQFDLEKSNMFTDINDSRWNTPLTKRPDSIVGWYKANPGLGDLPTVKVILHTDSSSIPNADSAAWIALAYWKGQPGIVVDSWTRFSTPFNYNFNDNPEYILTILTSGDGLSAVDNSEAWFDDLQLIYNDGTSIIEKDSDKLEVNIYNNQLSVFLRTNKKENYALSIYDLNGRLLLNDSGITGQKNLYKLGLSSGIYIVSVNYSGKVLTKKIIL